MGKQMTKFLPRLFLTNPKYLMFILQKCMCENSCTKGKPVKTRIKFIKLCLHLSCSLSKNIWKCLGFPSMCVLTSTHTFTQNFKIPGYILGRCMCENKYQNLHRFFQQAPKHSVLSLFFDLQTEFFGISSDIFKSAWMETVF